MPLPTLVTLLLAVGIAGAIFVVLADRGATARSRGGRAAATAADTDAQAHGFVQALDTVARLVEGVVQLLGAAVGARRASGREKETAATTAATRRDDAFGRASRGYDRRLPRKSRL